MAGTIEIVVNEHISSLLRTKRKGWAADGAIRCETTGTLQASGKRPDIVVCHDPQFPVAIETEFYPAKTVEADAVARIGESYLPTGGVIYSALAVRIPDKYKSLAGTKIDDHLMAETALSYCIYYGATAAQAHRWPSSGFIEGGLEDIAFAVATARASPHLVDEAANVLEAGAKRLAAMLEASAPKHPAVAEKLAATLKQEPGLQTFRMSATILINAFVFQETLAGGSGPLASVCSIYELGAHPSKGALIAAWDVILEVNYWPIFGVARDLIRFVPSEIWHEFVSCALEVADQLISLNLGGNPDLIGTTFQRLISDRRFLATFYTSPSSATLMARLVIGSTSVTGTPLHPSNLANVRIGDFACGTGSLLSGAYSEVRRLIEESGHDSAPHHRAIIESSLVGCDVLPSATHITASQLSSAHPQEQYTRTRILTLPFGADDNGSVSLGSIDLLEKQGVMPTIATAAAGAGAKGEEKVGAWEAVGGASVSDQGFDFVLMNPPFTRLTGGGGKSEDVSRPLFAAFATDAATQKKMAAKAARLTKGTVYHANAGAGAIFVEIGHRKLKSGGRIGLILPLSCYSGSAWEACRQLWRQNYNEIIIFSIAAGKAGATAFSADTSIPEALIVARRGEASDRLTTVSLTRRPSSILEGAEIARRVAGLRQSGSVRSLEGGPAGGTPLFLGDEKVGEAIEAPIPAAGSWSVFRIKDHAVAQTAYQLSIGQFWLPSMSAAQASEIAVCPLAQLGSAGPYHLDIGGKEDAGGAPRGPFDVRKTDNPAAVSYPIMAAHDEQRERTIELSADSEGIARSSGDQKVAKKLADRLDNIWSTKTHLHFSTDLRFNANALVACFTSRESVGGRAWPSFLLHERSFERVLTLWFNSTLGIVTFWWLANKGQDGRGSVTTTRLGTLTSFDPRKLTPLEVSAADAFFESFKGRPLMDVHEIALDDARADLDEFVAEKLLKVPDLTIAKNALKVLRAKLADEPSITGR